MKKNVLPNYVLLLLLMTVIVFEECHSMSKEEKNMLRLKTLDMFRHAYFNYMDHAYPADELMPLSCKGRYRGVERSRGDIDDALGNFSLSLIDTLDTLAILGEVDEFERAVRLVVNDVTFDTDVVVSLFETNIRVLGGLLGGHLMAVHLQKVGTSMKWYNSELLHMAHDLGRRLLPAFNTSTGMPYPRVNLRYGVKHEMSRTGGEKDTCTACAGSMLLEFSALSRLTGDTVFEEKAVNAMDYLWQSRHRTSDLVGTVINIHNGDWVRRDSGVGAGIDSYYEYLLKAYIMLGDETYLERFNKHYRAVMKYISNGPMMLDVHMHKPQTNSRNFMDALLAFWPGLQVLKGDLKSAIQMHEMLYQIIQRHNFLPEAFTTDFRVHWAQHPLRPEFVESTYFIYKATGDPYYLEVGKSVIDNLERLARVPCGFAAIKDVTTGTHEDQMDSFVLAETFKYLFLLFSDKEDLLIDIDNYVFTTEAHLLPLFLSTHNTKSLNVSSTVSHDMSDSDGTDTDYEADYICPSSSHLFKSNMDFAHHIRHPLKNMVEQLCPKPVTGQRISRLKASDFIAGNTEHMRALSRMGIHLVTMNDGRVQLLHISSEAATPEDSSDGMLFMHDMIELSKVQQQDAQQEPRVVQLVSHPFLGSEMLRAGPAQFGLNLKSNPGVQGQVAFAVPFRACQPLTNSEELRNKIAIVERGDCMFVDKARHVQNAGAVGAIVFDNNSQSSADNVPLFSMSGDGLSDITIPLVFLFGVESRRLSDALLAHSDVVVYVGETARQSSDILMEYFLSQQHSKQSRQQNDDNAGQEMSTVSGVSADSSDAAVTASAAVKQIVSNLLERLSISQLVSYIDVIQSERSSAGGSNDGVTGGLGASSTASQVHIIRSQDTATAADDSELQSAGNTFSVLLQLLQRCTNWNTISDASSADALARLTENIFTDGRMGFGVQTEAAVADITRRLTVLDTCSHYVATDAQREINTDNIAFQQITNLPNVPTNIKVFAAPSWMNVKVGQVRVTRDNIMFINIGNGEQYRTQDKQQSDDQIASQQVTINSDETPASTDDSHVDTISVSVDNDRIFIDVDGKSFVFGTENYQPPSCQQQDMSESTVHDTVSTETVIQSIVRDTVSTDTVSAETVIQSTVQDTLSTDTLSTETVIQSTVRDTVSTDTVSTETVIQSTVQDTLSMDTVSTETVIQSTVRDTVSTDTVSAEAVIQSAVQDSVSTETVSAQSVNENTVSRVEGIELQDTDVDVRRHEDAVATESVVIQQTHDINSISEQHNNDNNNNT